MSFTLIACSHNAPAPVMDATLHPIQVRSQQHSSLGQSQAKPYQNPGQRHYQKPDPSVDTSFAISDIPRSTEIISRNTGFNASTKIDNPTPRTNTPDKPYVRLDSQPATQHKVKRGETLFAIAWQYSLDRKELAQINNITGGKIYPGQLLNLTHRNSSGDLAKISQSKVFNKSRLLASLDRDILSEVKKTKPISTSKSKKISKSVKNKKIKASVSSNSSVKQWLWPVNGQIIQHFSNRSNNSKGLDIAAKRGTPVRATANGKVVYSGSGLRGYGQLVIIKHNDVFLSAYAHNEKLHVQENEFVKAGQKIADLGSSGSDKDKLHFEIRYKGKPVDPLNYLPKSGQLAYR